MDIFEYIADTLVDEFNDFLHQAKLNIRVVVEKINEHKRVFMQFDNGKIDFSSNASILKNYPSLTCSITLY